MLFRSNWFARRNCFEEACDLAFDLRHDSLGREGVAKGDASSVCADAMVMWPCAPLRRPQSIAVDWVKDKGLEGFRRN